MAVFGGTPGNDIITGSNEADQIFGGDGDDLIYDNGGNDLVEAGNGNDLCPVGAGSNRINGGPGEDVITFIARGSTLLDVAAGTASYTGGTTLFTGFENYQGSTADDILRGSAAGETIRGSFGNDRIAGRGGDDVLNGERGDDLLNGGAGRDLLIAERGEDRLNGGAGDDTLVPTPTFGTFTLLGGAGTDLLDLVNILNETTVRLAEGTFSRIGSSAVHTLGGIENVRGCSFADDIRGDDLGNGLFGDGGDDLLDGAGGDDRLRGGDGTDALFGGSGADRFVFKTVLDSAGDYVTCDLIGDFSQAEGDRIVLKTIDAVQDTPGVNEAFTYIGSAEFSAPGQVRWFQQGGNTFVALNTDSSFGNEMAIRLTGTIALSAADFVL